MSDETILTWANYSQSSPDIQETLLTGIVDSLPHLTWRQQAECFNGAPADVILYFLPMLTIKAQKKVYDEYLPVGSYEKAELSEETKIALKLRRRWQCLA
jgi:hypothetical protein